MHPQPSTAGPSPAQILQLGFAFFGSKTLLSAVELGLFTELAKSPLDSEAIRVRLGLHPRGIHDFLDALVSLGMLQRADGVYSNTPDSDFFLDRAKPSYVGGILEMFSGRLYGFYGSLTEALRTGRPQNEAAHGGPDFFQDLYSDPVRLKGFLAAMTGLSKLGAQAIAAKFPWQDYRTFADIGCAQGALPVQIALAHPHLQGIGFDLPPVGRVFEEYVASFGLADRVRFLPGSFFTDPLPSADVITMGHILHDWDLEMKKMLIGKAYAALPEGGALIVHENLIDDDRRTGTFGLLTSLIMLVESPAGFDFTGADCQGWMREAGFCETRVVPLIQDGMVIGIK